MPVHLSETEDHIRNEGIRLSSYWRARNARLEEFYKLRRLVDVWRKNLNTSYVTNRPLNAFNIGRHMLSSGPLRIRAQIGRNSLEERDRDAKTERAAQSILRSFDDRHWRLTLPPWRQALNDQILMGWVNIFYGVFQQEDGAPDFRADIWDNLTVYHEEDDEGLSSVLHEYAVTPAAAYAKALRQGVLLDLTRSGQQERSSRPSGIVVQDLYYKRAGTVWHGMVIGGQEVLPMEEEPGLKDIPVLVVPVNGEMRRSAMSVLDDHTVHMFAPFLATMERTLKDFNEIMTLVKNVTWLNAFPNYFDETEDAQGALNADDLGKGGKVHHLASGEKAGMLATPQMMKEFGDIMALLDSELQRASFPNTLFADVASDTSGYLFSQLQAAALTNLGPYNSAQEFILRTLTQHYVDAFRDGDFKPITIKGRSMESGFNRGYFMEEWRPADVRPQVWLDVRTELALPRNRIQEISAMRQANTGTPNLFDHFTLLDEVGGVDDPQTIMDRLQEDAVRTSPAGQAATVAIGFRRFAEYYRSLGDTVAAEVFNTLADRELAAFDVAPPGTARPAQPGTPPNAGGVQAANGQSPDVMRALLGRGAPQNLRGR